MPPNVSILVGDEGGVIRAKHHLYVQGRSFVITADEGRLARSIVRTLGVLTATSRPHTLRLAASLVISPSGSVVVDHRLAGSLRMLEPSLRHDDVTIIDLPWLDVDPTTATATLTDCVSTVGLDRHTVDQRWSRTGVSDDLRCGDVVIDSVVYAGSPQPASPTIALAELGPVVARPDDTLRTTDVRRLDVLRRATRAIGVTVNDRRRLRSALGFG